MFKNAQAIPHKAAIIDLDGKGSSIRQGHYDVAKGNKKSLHGITTVDVVYFMVQKMEAWFLSQPEILKEYFGKDFNDIPFDHPSKIENPDTELMRMTQNLKAKSYHKVRDGSRLLGKLDLHNLSLLSMM